MSNPGCDEEINLREFIQIINKRKTVILSITFVVLTLTGIINFLMPKTYEVKAAIQNGSITMPIITNLEAITLLKSEDFLRPRFEKLGMALNEGEIREILSMENIKETSIFIIKVRLSDKKLALELTQEIVNAYLDYGNSFYNAQHVLINDQIKELDGLMDKTKILAEGEGKKLKETQKGLSSIVFPDYHVQIKELLTNKFNLESQLVLAKKFKLIESPSEPKYPVAPNCLINIILAGILGLSLGLFYVFMLEAYNKEGRK
ncbi:MAG: Wzz/FepE/Etk N-terminal domain-containing protein [bacterium]